MPRIALPNVYGAAEKCAQSMLTTVALSAGIVMLAVNWCIESFFDSH